MGHGFCGAFEFYVSLLQDMTDWLFTVIYYYEDTTSVMS